VLENPNAETTDRQIAFKDSLKIEIDRSLSTLTEAAKRCL
jgi:hypothetical protein